jgi:hypothetical protein
VLHRHGPAVSPPSSVDSAGRPCHLPCHRGWA